MKAELRFVGACCRWPDDEQRRAAMRRAAAEVVTWEGVLLLAAEHRVEGLVANGVAALSDLVPEEVAAQFAAAAERVKARALQDLGETLRLGEALDRAGIGYCILKGVPLGIRAFGTPLLKQSWDVDVLVGRDDAVAAAAAVVAGFGYRPFLPPRPLTAGEFARWSAVSKEAEFHSAGRAIELHWGLADHPLLLAGMGVAQADARVELLGGRSVATLEDAANLAYLAVHGAFHGWSRLKWIADFAAFLGSFEEGGRAAVIGEARRWQTGAAIDQALLLAERLLGSHPGVAQRTHRSEKLAGLAELSITRRAPETDFDSDPVAARAISRAQTMLAPGLRYRGLLALNRLRGSEDRRHLPLPPALTWAYWPLRPFTAAWRAARRFAKRWNRN